MKNSVILLSFCFLLFSDAFAQSPVRLKKVLISRYTTNANGYAPWDSTVFYYSGANKGYLNNEIFYTTMPDYWGTGLPWVSFDHDLSAELKFDPGMQYDSAIKYRLKYPGSPKYAAVNQEIINNTVANRITGFHNYLANKWHHYLTSIFSYSGGLIVSHTDSGKHLPGIVQIIYHYNNNGFPDSVVTTASNGSKQKTAYTYNNNLLVERIYFTGNGRTYKTLYSYDSNGLLTGELMSGYDSTLSVWDTAGGRNFIYNSSNQLLQEKRWKANGYVWLMIDITYDGSNNRVEDVIHCDYSRPGLSTGFVKYVRKQYRYNSFGLINDYEVTHWNDSLQAWVLAPDSIFNASQKVKLEYEVYWPQDVSSINPAKSGVTIFPSPASGFITVKAEDMPTGNLEAIIYDMQGRTLRKWVDKSDGTYLRTIPVQELPSGTYFLQLTGKDISRNTQFVIYR